MTVVFDGTFPVHYGQAYVLGPGQANSDLDDAFVGQENGLLGAAVEGQLWLTTGLHTGRVRLRIERVTVAPPAHDDHWHEVVEASFTPAAGAALTGWAGEAEPVPLGLDPLPHRARLCARNMDEARQQDTLVECEATPVDEYLLIFWPAPPEPDRVVKQTSEIARYWHGWARSLPRR